MNKFLRYLKQPSTWRGIIQVAAGAAVMGSPDITTDLQTLAAAMTASGVINVGRDEDKQRKPK